MASISPKADLVLPAEATLGEGVSWNANRKVLLWVDILASEVHLFDPAVNKDRCIRVGQYVGAAVPTNTDDTTSAPQ